MTSSWFNRYAWAIRRELWEHPWIYLAPVCGALVYLVAFLVYGMHLGVLMHDLLAATPVRQHAQIGEPYDLGEALVMAVGLLAGLIYCLDSLYGERRDRSILFWKSLPVSDGMTVVAKASIPIVLLPLIIFATTVVMHLSMLLASTAILSVSGQSSSLIWSQFNIVQNSTALFWHVLMVHGVSAAPIYGWILLVSAWAPRAPFIWALVPPLVLGYLERLALTSTRFFDLLTTLVTGGGDMSALSRPGASLMERSAPWVAWHAVTSPVFVSGLVAAGLLLVIATRVRRAARPI